MLNVSDWNFTEQEEVDYITSLDEMATIGWDEREGILLQVNPVEGYIGGDYFKLFNAVDERRASKVARINFTAPLYTIHARKWNRGKDYWWLNSREKKVLIEFLESTNTDHPEYTNWQYAILEFNKGKRLNYEQTKSNLLSSGKLNFPNALPYDLPIPDYMSLPKDANQNEKQKREIEKSATEPTTKSPSKKKQR